MEEEEYDIDPNLMTVQTIRSYLGTMEVALDQNKHNKAYYIDLFNKATKDKESKIKLLRRLKIQKEIDEDNEKQQEKEKMDDDQLKKIEVTKMYADNDTTQYNQDSLDNNSNNNEVNKQSNISSTESRINTQLTSSKKISKGRLFFLFGPIILLILALILKVLSLRKIKPTQP